MLISNTDILIRLLVAFFVGILMGEERTFRQKPAGTSTHTIVCLSSTLVTIISAYGFGDFASTYTMDPARLVTGILTGVGFIGAGIIWKESGSATGKIKGITTAANIFLVACLGIAIGLGHFFLAGVTVALAILVLEASIWRKIYLNKKTQKEASEHQLDQSEQDIIPGEWGEDET